MALGPFVKALLELSPGTNLVRAGSLISWGDWCNIWGRVNGVECTFERQDRRVVEDAAGVIGQEIADMYRFFEEYGYWCRREECGQSLGLARQGQVHHDG